MLFGLIARLLRLASIVICAIAIIYFAAFALNQSSNASSHQQAEVNAAAPAGTSTTSTSQAKQESGAHKAIDEAFAKLASPFSGVVSSSSGAWTIHIVDTLLVLFVYGFGLAFIARLLKLGL